MPLANTAAPAGQRASDNHPTYARGINFHHLLNWPSLQSQSQGQTYIWPPFDDDKYKLRPEDLSLVRALGFDFIRLTVDPGLWISESARHGKELERRYWDTVETLLAADLNVILDLAPVDNHPDYTPARVVSPEETQKFAAYASTVAQAARLLLRAPKDRVALELFNEPPLVGDAGEARWGAMQTLLHTRARDVAPELTLILTAAHWGDGSALTRLDGSPYAGSNVIYTFHYYEPHLFTHQGTKRGAISYISGLDWPLTTEQAENAARAAEQAVADDKDLEVEEQIRLRSQIRHDFAALIAEPHDTANIVRDFDAVAGWAQVHAIAPQRILLGEFGCVLASRGRSTGEARLRWLTYVRRAAETHGFGWAYWAFKGYGGMELVDAKGMLHVDLVSPLGLIAP
jgi:endoglucanase